jgi:phosphoserine phosphatase
MTEAAPTLRQGGAPPPFAAVYFDCDSTLARIEGVDELVGGLPAARRQELLALTEQAMNGTLPLADVYAQRLHTIAPTRAQLQAVGRSYCAHPVADAALVVAALRHLGKHVGIVSGGLLEPVLAFAEHLGIDRANVHAVPLVFAADGSYRDFDRSSPLWRNGGKIEVLRALPAAHRPLAFVGDGVTDLETQGQAADRFVGFGGVAVRPRVAREAEAWFAAPTLAPLLQLVLTDGERRVLAGTPRFDDLLARA